MIDANGWVSWMRREDGPEWKGQRYGVPNACEGVVPHSAVGFAGNNIPELNNPARVGAWWWFNPYDGKAVQHYSLLTSLAMHSDTYANTHYVGWETEGGFNPTDEPWTDAQLQTAIRFSEDFEEWRGLTLVREPIFARNVHEHREFTNTACPSGRNARYYDWLANRKPPEEDEMTEQQVIDLVNRMMLAHASTETEIRDAQVGRLNGAVVDRLRLINLASGDYARVESALRELRAAGFDL